MADISKIKTEDVTYDIKDSTARTNIGDLASLTTSEKSNLVGAINEINTVQNDIIPFYAILRPTSEGWIILDNSGHSPLNVQGVTIDNNRLKLLHDNDASKIYSFSIVPDETFAKYNIHAGASVGVDFSLIDIYINTTAVAYFRYANSEIEIQNDYSNLVKDVEWNSTTSKMEVTFADDLRCARMKNWRVSSNDVTLANTYDYFCTWADDLTLSVVAYDKETHTAQALSGAYDRLIVSCDFEGLIAPGNLVSHPIDGANFWVCGYLKA